MSFLYSYHILSYSLLFIFYIPFLILFLFLIMSFLHYFQYILSCSSIIFFFFLFLSVSLHFYFLNKLWFKMIKGTASLILSHPPCKDLQRYPGNLNCIKNVEDDVIFLTRKVFFFLLIFSTLTQRNWKWKYTF